MLLIDFTFDIVDLLHLFDVVEVGLADLGVMQVFVDVQLVMPDRFDGDFANDLALCFAILLFSMLSVHSVHSMLLRFWC